jgi:hypothetical protein
MTKLNQFPAYISVLLESEDKCREVWLDLPVTRAMFADALTAIDCDYRNVRIAEYRVYGIGTALDEIMTTPFSAVNYLAARLLLLTPYELLKLRAISESVHGFLQVRQVIEYTFTADNYALLPGITDAEMLGRYFIGEPDFTIRSATRNPISRYEYGIKLAQSEGGVFVSQGYLTSKIGWEHSNALRAVPDSPNEDLYSLGA